MEIKPEQSDVERVKEHNPPPVRPEVIHAAIKALGPAGWDVPFNALAIARNQACRVVDRWLELMQMSHNDWEEAWCDELCTECNEAQSAVMGVFYRFFPFSAGFPAYGDFDINHFDPLPPMGAPKDNW